MDETFTNWLFLSLLSFYVCPHPSSSTTTDRPSPLPGPHILCFCGHPALRVYRYTVQFGSPQTGKQNLNSRNKKKHRATAPTANPNSSIKRRTLESRHKCWTYARTSSRRPCRRRRVLMTEGAATKHLPENRTGQAVLKANNTARRHCTERETLKTRDVSCLLTR